MKKILLSVLTLIMSTTLVFAVEILKAETITPISTKKPVEDISVKVLESISLGDINLQKGYVLNGKMIDVVQPQKMGKNATFAFKIMSYEDLNGQKTVLNTPIKVQYRQQMRPNIKRSSFTIGDAGGSGFVFSPHDITIAKESKGVGDFLKKELIKDSMFDTGWDIELKSGQTIKFNVE